MSIPVIRNFILLSLFIYSGLLFAIPTVTNVKPAFGSAIGGNSVMITGSGFNDSVMGVTFGNKSAYYFTVLNDSTIEAIVPQNSPGVNEVTVTTIYGTSALNPPGDYYTYQGDWFAYIPDFGSSNVYPIDIATQVVGFPITAERGPNDVVFTPNGKIALCVNSVANSVTVIDVATQTPLFSVDVDVSFPILAITPDGTKAAIVGYGSNTVSMLDLTTFVITMINVGSQPTSIAMVPNGSVAYVTNSGSSSLTQIDLQTFATSTIQGPPGSIPSFIEITPDGMTALVSDDATNSVYIFDPINLMFGSQIYGFFFQGADLFPEIAITPDGTTAWITNTSSNTISSIIGLNTPNPSFGSSITVAMSPNGIAITPDGKQAYVSNATSNTTSIVTFSTASSIDKMVGILPTDGGITPDQAPVAYFQAFVGFAGQSSLFDASASLSPVGTIASYAWDFGDGSPLILTSSPMISHSYAQPGPFNVTLTVANSAGTSLVQVFTGQVMLNNGGPSAQTSLGIIVLSPPPVLLSPTVTSVRPSEGSIVGGTSMIITGTNFTDVTAVNFGITPAVNFSIISPTEIIAISPPGIGTVNIRVTTTSGTSMVSPADQFTYLEERVPLSHLRGFQIFNKFANQTNYINFLTWEAPCQGPPIKAYKIFRDKNLHHLIATLPGNQHMKFRDPNRRKGRMYTYSIVPIGKEGNHYQPTDITISGVSR